jgi:fatty-acyl-CoA synthase
MGLVGIVLGCVATQRSVDYLPTRDFAMRPRLWLKLIARNRSTISFSPPFGYTLCARRLRPTDIESLDLSSWRVAGVGAEMIHPESLRQVAEILAPTGFDERAFLPCYGMAECSLAVSFAPVGRAPHSDLVDVDLLSRSGNARPPVDGETDVKGKALTDCGKPLPGFEVEIRDERGRVLPERRCGTIFLRGASVMSGYFDNPDATRMVLSGDGWLDTGDIGYRADGSLYLTGRAKDLMIIKGRNIWPQDLEYLAESQPEVRSTDASAFTVPDLEDNETAVLVVQCREIDPRMLEALSIRLQQAINAEFGIHCLIELVPPHTLPRTSSGKLSRSMARSDFLRRYSEQSLVPVTGNSRPRAELASRKLNVALPISL